MPIAQPAAPDKKPAAKAKSQPAATQEDERARQIRELSGYGQILAALAMVRGLPEDGMAIGMHAESIAKGAVTVGEQDEKIGKAIRFLCDAGPYVALVTPCIALAGQLAANHGVKAAASIPGVRDPRLLKAEAELMQSKMVLQAKARQQEIDAELAELAAMQRSVEFE
jgi:hypothetical protein